jgi:hypothetical protein
MKIHISVQKLLVGGGGHRQAGDLISLLLFLKGGSKIILININRDKLCSTSTIEGHSSLVMQYRYN